MSQAALYGFIGGFLGGILTDVVKYAFRRWRNAGPMSRRAQGVGVLVALLVSLCVASLVFVFFMKYADSMHFILFAVMAWMGLVGGIFQAIVWLVDRALGGWFQ